MKGSRRVANYEFDIECAERILGIDIEPHMAKEAAMVQISLKLMELQVVSG